MMLELTKNSKELKKTNEALRETKKINETRETLFNAKVNIISKWD